MLLLLSIRQKLARSVAAVIHPIFGLLLLRCRRQASQGPWTIRRGILNVTTAWPLLSTRSRVGMWMVSLCLQRYLSRAAVVVMV